MPLFALPSNELVNICPGRLTDTVTSSLLETISPAESLASVSVTPLMVTWLREDLKADIYSNTSTAFASCCEPSACIIVALKPSRAVSTTRVNLGFVIKFLS